MFKSIVQFFKKYRLKIVFLEKLEYKMLVYTTSKLHEISILPMAKDYDKIVQENLAPNIVSFVEYFLGLDIPKTESIVGKLGRTVEKEPDFMFKVIHDDSKELINSKKRKKKKNKDYIIHLEFQTLLKKRKFYMVLRMLFYKTLLLLKFNLPVRQYVIYMSEEPHGMALEYKDEHTYHRMEVIDMKEIDYKLFLQSGRPEIAVFAILGNFHKETPKKVITEIILKLKTLVGEQVSLSKYSNQLRILSKLRSFEAITFKILENMPLTIDVETDVLYLKGQEIGKEIGKEIGTSLGKKEQSVVTVINMLLKTNFSIEQIADLAVADKNLVMQLHQEFSKTNAKVVFNQSKNKGEKNKATALVQELLKMPTLSNISIASHIDQLLM